MVRIQANNLLFFTHFEYLRGIEIFTSWKSTIGLLIQSKRHYPRVRIMPYKAIWAVRQIYTLISFHLPFLNRMKAAIAMAVSAIGTPQNAPTGPSSKPLASNNANGI